MKLVCLDANIIRTLAGEPSSVDRGKERAAELISDLRAEGVLVAIPAPALAECSYCDKRIWKDLLVLDLNAPAALLACKLTNPMLKSANKKAPRQCVKADAMILATAEIHGCSKIYTTDAWFADVATEFKLKVQARDLPPLAMKQRPLLMPVKKSTS